MIEKLIAGIFSNMNVVLLVLGVIIGLITGRKGNRSEHLFRWVILLGAGLTGLYTAVMHVFFPAMTAAGIGWQTSPFQYEVGMANLGFGLLCVLAFRASFSFRLAAVIGLTCWLWGDAVGHIHQMIIAHNYSPGNAGVWFWTDVIVPPTLMILLALTRRR
jgi:hypothetical protein